MNKTYDTVIGLEIHAELSTQTKVFCTCSAEFGGDPNTHICPVCTGQPGALPIINRAAVEYAVRAGLAFGCDINRYSRFDRKNYFYPDLPKAYQISQLDLPLCINGKVELSTGTTVRINRIHLEEDAGKLLHDDYHGQSWADYNRCSVPLIEIVTEPDMKSPEEAAEFVSKVGLYLKYLNVCDAKMQEGSIRADVNISIKEQGSDVLGERAEIKNLNSFRAIQRAIEYEVERQTEIVNGGGRVEQETRRFDDMTTTPSISSGSGVLTGGWPMVRLRTISPVPVGSWIMLSLMPNTSGSTTSGYSTPSLRGSVNSPVSATATAVSGLTR